MQTPDFNALAVWADSMSDSLMKDGQCRGVEICIAGPEDWRVTLGGEQVATCDESPPDPDYLTDVVRKASNMMLRRDRGELRKKKE